ncbi:MAG: tRNA lysidine(34) synthetase TilS [Deltaproteobacteria bacterium]|nr:MAG: tRNA lysidine(34) synthetase TilS [Deltaproteobacteria bacterium]
MPGKPSRFLSAVEGTIYRYHMLDAGDTVLVGVSGGPDSVALLHSLVALRDTWSLDLIVAHLNHQLRGVVSDREAAFVRRLAARLKIPCEISSRNVASYKARHRLSLEQAGRAVRYAFYDEVAARYRAKKIALGHQANDNAESILIHLLRGTGPRGLAGIQPIREGRIIRPLIEITRKEILAFLNQSGFEYVQDASNLDRRYLRNRIRNDLLPVLQENFNPKVVFALTRLASIVRDEEDFWKEQIENRLQDLLLKRTSDCITLSLPGLIGLHPAFLRRLIREAVLLLKGNLRRLGHLHVEAVCELIKKGPPSGRLNLPRDVLVVRDRDELSFLLGPLRPPPKFEYEIDDVGTTFIREIGMLLKLSMHDAHDGKKVFHPQKSLSTAGFFDMDRISFPLKLRNWENGDRFRPLGMKGFQKVKTFFINHKVPRKKRLQCPILLSEGRIIWVGGYRIDDTVKVTEQTRRLLKAELLPE